MRDSLRLVEDQVVAKRRGLCLQRAELRPHAGVLFGHEFFTRDDGLDLEKAPESGIVGIFTSRLTASDEQKPVSEERRLGIAESRAVSGSLPTLMAKAGGTAVSGSMAGHDERLHLHSPTSILRPITIFSITTSISQSLQEMGDWANGRPAQKGKRYERDIASPIFVNFRDFGRLHTKRTLDAVIRSTSECSCQICLRLPLPNFKKV
jgi:hypothetical protein